MSAPLKDKIQVFLFGLLLGLVIGVGFFVFKLDSYFKELSIRREKIKEEHIITKSDDKGEVKTKVVYKQLPPNDDAGNGGVQKSEVDSSSVDSISIETNLSVAKSDSIVADSLPEKLSEEIVVRKDERVASKNMKVYSIPDTTKKLHSNDSLLSELSGMNKQTSTNTYVVEYWVSPLNYKGYMLTKNKLILYGIDSAEPVQLVTIAGKLYIRRVGKAYSLRNSSSFQHFEEVMDEKVLAMLKKVE